MPHWILLALGNCSELAKFIAYLLRDIGLRSWNSPDVSLKEQGKGLRLAEV
jgi:hypothetical protein